MGLTLEDVLNLQPEEIIKRMKTASPTAKVEIVVDDQDAIDLVKKELKGFFADDPTLLERGRVLHVGDRFVDVTGVLPSTGRVFFKIQDNKSKFSLSYNYLTGKEEEFPFKRGDKAQFESQIWDVVGISPASNNVTLKLNGIKKVVNFNKVTKVVE